MVGKTMVNILNKSGYYWRCLVLIKINWQLRDVSAVINSSGRRDLADGSSFSALIFLSSLAQTEPGSTVEKVLTAYTQEGSVCPSELHPLPFSRSLEFDYTWITKFVLEIVLLGIQEDLRLPFFV